ncbi:unnamed protein product [Symbiodinium sp. KB8]|nr:unnamed protein product [Symbiodinium sp. KB8]
MKQDMFLRLFFACALCPVGGAMKAGSLSGRSKDAGGPSPAPATSVEENFTEAMIDNMQHDAEQEPESDGKEAGGELGMGELAKNLEFLMLKETSVELLEEKTQKQEQELQKCMEEKTGPKPSPSLVEIKALNEERAQRAQTVLEKVLRKHERQRETRQFVTPVSLEQQEQDSSRWNPADWIKEAVEKAVSKVADHLAGSCPIVPPLAYASEDGFGINLGTQKCTVTLAGKTIPLVNIQLGHIYQAWPEHIKTAITIGVNFKDCAVIAAHGTSLADRKKRLFGCFADAIVASNPVLSMSYALFRDLWKCNLDSKWKNFKLSGLIYYVYPKKAKPFFEAVEACDGANAGTMDCIGKNIMKNVLHCQDLGSAQAIAICMGNNLINYVPPFTFLNKIGDIVGDMIEGFARLAAGLMKQVLSKGQALIQQAVSTKFPSVGDGPLVHHESSNLMIYTHSAPKKRGMSALQEEEGPDGLGWSFGADKSHQQTRLVTQFHGHEVDTSSCLAFAPKSKHGHNGQATEADWQVQDPNDFVPLEPWAVPCGNAWMKDNADKWQGYSFYSTDLHIDECLTITYSVNIQPVAALIGGVNIEVMPKKWAEILTTICWPKTRPGGLDLSILKTEIKSHGITLFSRTLRLTKRFGDGNAFFPHNVHASTSTWKKKNIPRAAMSRTKLLQTDQGLNHSGHSEDKHEEEEEDAEEDESLWEWQADPEDLYLASGNFTDDGLNLTSELHGHAAAHHLGLLQEAAEAQGIFELFNLQRGNSDLVSFRFRAVLEGNSFQLRTQMGFGPFEMKEKSIQLINIMDQFKVALHALPWVSHRSAVSAMEALKSFSASSLPFVDLEPGSTIALMNPTHRRYVQLNSDGNPASSGALHSSFPGLPADWIFERWTVIDVGGGEIALHNARHNRFLSMHNSIMFAWEAAASEIKHHWIHQRWTVVNVGKGEIALWNRPENRLLKMKPDGGILASPQYTPTSYGPNPIPSDWLWERFRAEVLKPYLRVGMQVGLFNRHHKCWLTMEHHDMQRSVPTADATFPHGSWREMFTVVDAGYGQIALHNEHFIRFVSLQPAPETVVNVKATATAVQKFANDLPTSWTAERFAVVPAGDGQIALHNTKANRFLRMSPDDIDSSPIAKANELQDGWAWERWQVVEIQSADQAVAQSGVNQNLLPGWSTAGLR